jgi:tetratricopeptide (TPR) repeat protein
VLFQLHRYPEALTASKSALRLDDGKYAYEHFLLGSIYFEMHSWSDAVDEFKRVAEAEKDNTDATYNAALCYQNEGYRSDAANWFEETLRRNPKHPQREQLLKSIARLRGQ